MAEPSNKFVQVPYTQVRSDALCLYSLTEPRPERRYRQFDTKTYSGKMTDHAARRIKKTVDLFLQHSPPRIIFNPVTLKHQPFQLSFVTLTISCPEIITSNESYERLLAPFLRKLRGIGARQYIWKGELQKRGQPHYHLTLNEFVHHQEVRDIWNNLQTKAGYTNDYFQKHGHRNPPSTEIKSVRNLSRISMYLAKYLSKNEQQTGWIGKCWGCSDDLRKMKHFAFVDQWDTAELIGEALENKKARLVKMENCAFVVHNKPAELLPAPIKLEYAMHLKGLR